MSARSLEESRIVLRGDGVIEVRLSEQSHVDYLVLRPEDAATLAGRLVTLAGAAASDHASPFAKTIEVIRRGFDVYLAHLARDAEDAASHALIGAYVADTLPESVECPHCQAPAGERCTRLNGRKVPPHAARIEAFREAYPDATEALDPS